MSSFLKVGILFLGMALAAGAQTVAVAPVLATPPADKSRFHIYLLMGQSNMAGRDTRMLSTQVDNPRVLAMNTNGEWVVARDPIHPKEGRIEPGAGPGIPFALEMVKTDPNITIGLVPCAVGGTPLRRWVKGGDLYDRALVMAKRAGQVGTIRGVLWHQGESDSDGQKNAETYEARLGQMFKDLRTDLGAPELPIVVGQLGEFLPVDKHPYVNVVRAALKHIPAVVPHAGYADSAGLGDKGDHLHFDAAAQQKMGERFAATMMAVQREEASASLKAAIPQAASVPVTTLSNAPVELFPVQIDRFGVYLCTDAGRRNVYLVRGTNGLQVNSLHNDVYELFHIPKPDHGDDKISGMAMVNGKIVVTIGTSNYVTEAGWQK